MTHLFKAFIGNKIIIFLIQLYLKHNSVGDGISFYKILTKKKKEKIYIWKRGFIKEN